LTALGVEYKVIELNEGGDGPAFRAELGELTGRTSVPNIWIAGENIGGCNDGSPGLMPLIASGDIKAKLEKAAAYP